MATVLELTLAGLLASEGFVHSFGMIPRLASMMQPGRRSEHWKPLGILPLDYTEQIHQAA